MARGQHLTRHQQGIVRRYYEHLDSITLGKLADASAELFLCTDPKKAEKLWQSVSRALDKTAASDAQVKRTLDARDIKALAELVAKLSK